ncbi:hypothetical protein BDV25DRAFT_90662 [Aspergillus avenaceus]|uniref:BZIP domain-containing protein n=1 Tax=Aspergillus avenaceus TaxID=36643 RepID=A0A5N6TZ33_ASPAV|nr:hypothetical protein BDV25DRAFT_90662 [Aspergillus avenaceus]
MSSAERKRIRDRRAQQALREKKARRIAQLEEQVAHCEQHHQDHGIQRLLQVIQGLRRENHMFRVRQRRLKSFVDAWDVDPLGEDNLHGCPQECRPPQPHQNPPSHIPHDVTPAGTPPDSFVRPASSPPCPHGNARPANRPPWRELPLHLDDFSDVTTISCPWFMYLEEIIPCPDTPESPLDILYGTKTNPLANLIHKSLQRRPVRDPERLAIGWTIYRLSRWILSPSVTTYASLPLFLRPTADQRQIAHPLVLDFVAWPQIRSNFIRQWHLYQDQRDDLFGLLSCCIKIRWPWGEPILERNADNELCIKDTFYQTFMDEKGWGVTPEFIRNYPQLFAGVDVDSILYEVV